MTTLTKADRLHAVAAILKETFAERQDELLGRIEAAITEKALAQWPRFYELRKDKDNREFVRHSECRTMCFGEGLNRWGSACFVSNWSAYSKDADTTRARTNRLEVPQYYEAPTLPEDHGVFAEHQTFHEELGVARIALLDAFYAYKSREKMEAELPDLARYLPPRVVTGTSVIVKPADIMASLAKVGIPAKKEQAK